LSLLIYEKYTPGTDRRTIVARESMVNYGVGAEVAATIQDAALFHLEAPVKRIAGWTTHTGLAYERVIMPGVASKSILPPYISG